MWKRLSLKDFTSHMNILSYAEPPDYLLDCIVIVGLHICIYTAMVISVEEIGLVTFIIVTMPFHNT